MRWLTLPIGADQAGKPVSTLLRRELGLSAAGVRRAKALPGGILLDGGPRLYQRGGPAGPGPCSGRGGCCRQ